MTEVTHREIKTGRFIAICSAIFCILLIVHNFIALDTNSAKALLSLSGQKATDSAANYILNSFRFTGVMYILAYLAGVVTFWNRHMYVWWFMFAVYVSHSLFTIVNIGSVIHAISSSKGFIMTLPIIIVIVGSILLAVYMLIVSIKRKSTFNR